MASAQCQSPFLCLNNNVSATSKPFCSLNMKTSNPFSTFGNYSSNYQQIRIGLKQVHALLLLAFLLRPHAALGDRFVIDKEECFSYNVKYKENSNHVSFVMVKTDSACPFTENGAGDLLTNVKGDRKRKREETNVQKEEMEREIKELREQIQKASQRIDKLSNDLSLLDTNNGMEVNGDEEQMQQASQHIISNPSQDLSWLHATTGTEVNDHKERPSKRMKRVNSGY